MPSFPLPVVFGAIALLVGALAGRWVQRHTRWKLDLMPGLPAHSTPSG